MWKRAAKTLFPPRKSVILGLVFVLLLLLLSCGYVQTSDHSAVAEGTACERSFSIANLAPTKDGGLFLLVFLISFIAITIAVKSGTDQYRALDSTIHPSRAFLKVAESIPKLYNPILQALRRGILQPQIYNFAVAIR